MHVHSSVEYIIWFAFSTGTVFVLFSFPFLFTYFADIHGTTTERSSVLLCGLVIAVFQFGWAATQVSHLALIPQLTAVDSERTELSAFRLFIFVSIIFHCHFALVLTVDLLFFLS